MPNKIMLVFLFLAAGCASIPEEEEIANKQFDCNTFGIMTNLPEGAIYQDEKSRKKVIKLSYAEYEAELATNAKKIKTKDDYDKFIRYYQSNRCNEITGKAYPAFHSEIEYIMVLQSKHEILKNIPTDQTEFVEVREKSTTEKPKENWEGMHDFLLAHFNRKEFPKIGNGMPYHGDEFSFNSDKEKYRKIRDKKYIFIQTNQGKLSEYNFKNKSFLYTFAIARTPLSFLDFDSEPMTEDFQVYIPKGISIPINEAEAKIFKECEKDTQFISTYKVVATSKEKEKFKQLQLEPIKWRIRCTDSSNWYKNY